VRLLHVLLHDLGADVNLRDDYGQSALWLAALKGTATKTGQTQHTQVHGSAGYSECIEVLLLYGANIHAISSAGETVAHAAAARGTVARQADDGTNPLLVRAARVCEAAPRAWRRGEPR
jgi:ankyrin repeat protein